MKRKMTFFNLRQIIAVVFFSLFLFRLTWSQENLVRQIRMLQDRNGDGKIHLNESSGALKANFARIDKDRNNVLDESELTALARYLMGIKSSAPSGDANTDNAPLPKGVKLLNDVQYRVGNPAWRLDLTLPAEKGSSLRPAIVLIHGGAWKLGDKSDKIWRDFALRFAGQGFVCVSVNYRLAQEAPFPACVEDCQNAVRWLRQNAKKYKVDPDRIGAFGNSAGAHLASMLGLVDLETGKQKELPYRQQSSVVQAVVATAAPTDFTNWQKTELSIRGNLLYGDPTTLHERAKLASPVSHAHKNAPPFLIIHGMADELVPATQGRLLASALKAKGAKVTLKLIEEAGHGVLQQSQAENFDLIVPFLNRHLRNRQQRSSIQNR